LVTLEFPVACKIMVDGAIRIQSLANQLASTTRRINRSTKLVALPKDLISRFETAQDPNDLQGA
jgi:hypothetical protein